MGAAGEAPVDPNAAVLMTLGPEERIELQELLLEWKADRNAMAPERYQRLVDLMYNNNGQ